MNVPVVSFLGTMLFRPCTAVLIKTTAKEPIISSGEATESMMRCFFIINLWKLTYVPLRAVVSRELLRGSHANSNQTVE